MRIKREHYYVLSDFPGISGFRDFTRKVEVVVKGHKAANRRAYIDREYLANGRRYFRIHDGHLPDYCPVVSEVDALRWLDANPWGDISEVAAP